MSLVDPQGDPAPVETPVRITASAPANPAPGLLRGCSIDRPVAGETSATYAFEIEGWALGGEQAVAFVDLIHGQKRLWRLPPEIERPEVAAAHPDVPGAERCGFYGPVSTLTMEPEFELEVSAVFEDGSATPIGSLRGQRAPLRSSFEPRVQPLMITTLGRTGCHILMRVLSGHPSIVSYRPYEFETKVATYWTEILRSLSEPASYLRQLSHARNLNDRRWWLGSLGEEYAGERQTRPTMPRPLPDPHVDRWIGLAGVQALTEFCQGRIDALYREVADYLGRPDAAYFVEKYHPGKAVPGMLWEIYPDAREIVLVRDFRDVVASMFAFDAKRQFDGFGRARSGSDKEYVDRLAGRGVASLVEAWRSRSDRAHLLRYEDLILRPEETIQALLGYLGLDASEAELEPMLAVLGERTELSEWHRTAADPRASIGRWRRDLSPAAVHACEVALGPALEEFGYGREVEVGAGG